MELVRQPIYLLLMSSSAVFMVFLACVPYFGFGDDPKMLKDSELAVMLLAGLFGAVIGAAASVAHEIRSGTALAVLSKPVRRGQFLVAKFAGVAAALTVMTYVNGLAALLASRMAYDAYSGVDAAALGIFSAAVVMAFAIGGFSNYFLKRQFVADAVLSLVVLVTIAFVVIISTTSHRESLSTLSKVDWRLVPASVLILFALWIFAGLAVACATRLDMIPTLAICSALFLLGLMSDYLFGRPLRDGALWAVVPYTLLPNWQLFWMADTMEPGKAGVPLSYLAQALGYVAGYLGATLALALALFEDRELS
jgi:ABC-type transport system involved in multi-copper enzyme maturation permease subunit